MQGIEFLPGASFKGSYFKGVHFKDNLLKNAKFNGSIFEQVIISDVDASNANFDRCKIRRSVIEGSMLRNSQFMELNTEQDKTYANRAIKSDFSGALFHHANLEEFVFRDCLLEEAVFEDAQMRMAGLYGCQIQNADFTNALYLTLQQLKSVDITPKRNGSYIGGISQRNILLLLSMSLTATEFESLKNLGSIPLRDDLIFKYWMELAIGRYKQNIKLIKRLDSAYLTNERNLVKLILGDLNVKGIETLDALGDRKK